MAYALTILDLVNKNPVLRAEIYAGYWNIIEKDFGRVYDNVIIIVKLPRDKANVNNFFY